MSHRSGRRSHRLVAACVSGMLLASLAVASSAAPVSAGPKDCRVTNLDSGVTKASFRRAVINASEGDRLRVRGRCHGTTTIRKNLRIRGVRVPGSGRPTLDGDGAGSVLTITAGTWVSIRNLHIIDGKADQGGGAYNAGSLVLNGKTVVRGNQATMSGGGIYVNFGTLKLKGSSSIHHNDGGQTGGGVYNWQGTLMILGSSSIHHNTAVNIGGGFRSWRGTVVGHVCGAGGNVYENSGGDCSIVDP